MSLSETAYAALRGSKRSSESFSDVVLRLLHETRKNPLAFSKRRRTFLVDAPAHLEESEQGRAGDDPYAGA